MNLERDLTEAEWKEIGNRIRERRKSCSLKQSELAEAIGISVNHMSSIENGRQHPSVYVLIKLSEQLNATPDLFLMGSIRKNNVPQNIIDLLNVCDSSELKLIKDLIPVIHSFFNQTQD